MAIRFNPFTGKFDFTERNVVTKTFYTDFPAVGSENTLYVDKTKSKVYYWTGTVYKLLCCVSPWKQAVITLLDFTTSEPVTPAEGDRYINTATGTFSETGPATGTANYIYEWVNGAWEEQVPLLGDSLFNEATGSHSFFDGTGWVWYDVAPEHNFYYTPGGTASHNTYTDWDLLVADHDAVEGHKTIYFDDSNAPIDIVINGTDFGKTEWTAAHVVPSIVVTTKIADGSTIANWPWKLSGPIVVEGHQTVPLTTIASGFHAILIADGADLVNKSVTSVMMDITGGTSFVASQGMASVNLNDASTYEIFGLSTGGTLDIEFKGYANGDNIVRGTDGTYKFCERVGRYEVFPTNVNFSGTTINTYGIKAGALDNTSGVEGASIKNALDTLNTPFAGTTGTVDENNGLVKDDGAPASGRVLTDYGTWSPLPAAPLPVVTATLQSTTTTPDQVLHVFDATTLGDGHYLFNIHLKVQKDPIDATNDFGYWERSFHIFVTGGGTVVTAQKIENEFNDGMGFGTGSFDMDVNGVNVRIRVTPPSTDTFDWKSKMIIHNDF